MKQVVELQDGEHFVHTYDKQTIHEVVGHVCRGGEETGILDYVETREVGKTDGKAVQLYTEPRSSEKCNPYASVIPI